MFKDSLAIFAGSFDPITNGHVNIISRLLEIFNNVDVVVGNSPNKLEKYLFSQEERVELVNKVSPWPTSVYLIKEPIHKFIKNNRDFDKYKITIIKGLRNSEDLEYERKSLDVSESAKIGIDTLFMLADEKYRSLSSTHIKQIWNNKYINSEKQKILEMIPQPVFEAMDEKYKKLDPKF